MNKVNPRGYLGGQEWLWWALAWVVLDHAEATRRHGWRPVRTAEAILTEIAAHAERHPHWLEQCGG